MSAASSGAGRRVGSRQARDSTNSRPAAPYFLKVYGLNGPEVRGHALKCLRLDIQPRRTRTPGASRSRTMLVVRLPALLSVRPAHPGGDLGA